MSPDIEYLIIEHIKVKICMTKYVFTVIHIGGCHGKSIYGTGKAKY
jgi:hypothetical protein